MKRLLAISTSTVGGAILIVLLSTALGDKAPWFVEHLRASAGELYSVSLNVDEIFTNKRRAQKLNTEGVYIDHLHNFYIERPPEDWRIDTSDPGDFLSGLSFGDIPFIRYSFDAYSAMMRPAKVRHGDIVTVTFLPPDGISTLSFTNESRFEGIPLDLNPFEDRAFAKASVRAGATMMAQMMGGDSTDLDELLAEDTEEAREEFDEIWEIMREQGANVVTSNWPGEKEVRAGVTITTFRPHVFTSNPIASILERGGKRTLWSSLAFLQFMNSEIANYNTRQIDISRDNRVVLLDTSARLNDLMVNGTEVEEVELVKLFLIAMENELIYIVSLTYIHSAGTGREVVRDIERIFRSFRVLI